ncbi:hypothetical protein B0H17DRAFT_1212776 [Mycena rosella]|uniref:Uncharacterized protein n=1 Tax=Mycena rosella TaxID=1033263 RepID=A0AAD7G2K3_MYCRO|nr:hypothetical protein B0H17DRAFT_1212776 [Mycena rosella]
MARSAISFSHPLLCLALSLHVSGTHAFFRVETDQDRRDRLIRTIIVIVVVVIFLLIVLAYLLYQ